MGMMKEMAGGTSGRGGRRLQRVFYKDRLVLEYMGVRVLDLIKGASKEALAKGAGVMADKARAIIGKRAQDPSQSKWGKVGGYFGSRKSGVPYRTIASTVESGPFETRDSQAFGGFMRTTSLWWIIECGTKNSHKGGPTSTATGPNVKRPWAKPAFRQSRQKILSLLLAEYQHKVRDKAA